MTPTTRPGPIPDSYRRVTRCLTVADAAKALEFYSDRDGHIVDPFGHGWTVASHVKDVTPEEMSRRMAELFSSAES